MHVIAGEFTEMSHQKEAIVQLGVRKGLGRLGGWFASQAAPGVLKQTAKNSVRFMAGVKPGEAMFSRPHHYLTRPARLALRPNLGTALNTARTGVTAYSLGAGGYKVHDSAGDVADNVKAVIDAARARGVSEEDLSGLKSYTSRSGIIGGALRGNKYTAWMAGGQRADQNQRLLDQTISGATIDAIRHNLFNSARSPIKAHQVLNPVASVMARGAESALGMESSAISMQDRIKKVLGSERVQSLKDRGAKFSRGLQANLSPALRNLREAI